MLFFLPKPCEINALLAELYYLRTQDKAEIDLIVDWGQHSDFIEIKKTSTYKPKMATHLKKYASDRDRKIVLYNGSADQHGEIEILPYGDYLTEAKK